MAILGEVNNHEVTPNGITPALTPDGGQAPGKFRALIEKYTSCRWHVSYMLAMVLAQVQVFRACFSFAIVCMTGEGTQIRSDNESFIIDNYGNSSANTSGPEMGPVGEFDYSSETQGLILSAVNYGAIISPVIGSYTTRKFGAKKVIGLSMAASGILALLTPIAARTHLILLLVDRVFSGIAITVAEPVIIAFWLNWAPVDEKAQLVGYAYTGYTLGSVLVFAVSGNVCLIPIDNGWPFIFYIFGTCSLLWCVLWYFTIFDSPESHPRISEKEKTYIVSTRSKEAGGTETKNIPWKSIVTTKGVWAFVVVYCSHVWTTMVILSYLPLYMATILKFDISQNALLSSAPFISRGFGLIVWGHVGEKLVKHFSVTTTRKLVQCTGYFITAGFCVALCFIREGQEYIAVMIFIVSTPFQAVVFTAAIVTTVDMAPQLRCRDCSDTPVAWDCLSAMTAMGTGPKGPVPSAVIALRQSYAAVISSFGLCFAVIMLITSPLAVAYIIKDRTREQWALVFYMNAAIYVFASVVFLFCGSGKIQPWADNSKEKADTEDNAHKKGQVNESFAADIVEETRM